MLHKNENAQSAAAGLYAKHYGILQEIANRLRTGGPADIDMLLEDTRRAMESYEICRTRLDAVRTELGSQIGRS
jgi:hypothetical protein